jgi:TonB family protein
VAFESFRTYDDRRPRHLRRIAFALVAVFHGVLIAAGIVYSYWKVDELTPPTLRVTFMSGTPTPPPPPPPAPAGGGSRPKKIALRPKTPEPVVTKPPEIVQPPDKVKPIKKEFRKHEDEYVEPDNAKPAMGVGSGKIGDEDGDEDGEAGGVKGGQKGGVIGGSIGGVVTQTPPKAMPAQFGANHRISGDQPAFPPSLRRGDMVYVVEARICVSKTGSVDSVTLTKTSDTLLNENVVKAVRGWRYQPMKFNSMLVDYCFPIKFEFKSQQ